MTSERNDFRQVRLWQLAQDLADEVCDHLADSLPNTRSADVIARQWIRSATSIAANIAEGHGRFSFAAYRNHLGIARGSATESRGWIDLLNRRKLVSPDQAEAFDQKCRRLIALLTLRISDLDKKQASRAVKDGGGSYDAWIEDVRMSGRSDVRIDLDGEGTP